MSTGMLQSEFSDSANTVNQTAFASKASRAWASFARQIQFDVRLWLFGVVLLQLIRAALVWLFRHRIADTSGTSDIATVFLIGLRYDGQTAATFVLPGFVMSVACLFFVKEQFAERVRRFVLYLMIAACVVVGSVDLGYFHEFHDQFNHYAFGVLYDDFSAVLVTVWKQHPIVWELLGIVALIAALVRIGRRWMARDWLRAGQAERLTRTWARRIALLSVTVLMLAFALRGSIHSRPVQLKDVAVTKDQVLNKMVLNPFAAAKYAITGHLKLASGKGLELYLPDRDVRDAARLVAGRDESMTTVDDALIHVAKGPQGVPPKHVFFILMESYDAWPTLDRYRSLGLSERLLDLGRRGVFSRKFVSASSGTMTTFASMLTGLADAGVTTNYQPLTRQPFPSSINPIFQKLGLRTRMFLGGFFSWQRSDAFCLEQGFQELYAAPHFAQKLNRNEWGPEDRVLFDFVLRAVDPKTPSFNFIVTSSFHPPFSVDVYGHGFPHKEMPADLKSIATSDPEYLRMLGHLWYADQMLGEFVEAAEKKYPGSLFVITGDHTSRKFLNGQPTLYERTAVPFVMYGPDVLKGINVPSDLVGSHHDIMPTVFELLAPRGFEYHAIGHDMLDSHRPQIGFGRDQIIGRDFIASRNPGGEIEPLPDSRLPDSLPDLPRLQAEYKALLGVVWWRICRGAEFPGQGPVPTQTNSVNQIAKQPVRRAAGVH